jgi:hypothetical protein
MIMAAGDLWSMIESPCIRFGFAFTLRQHLNLQVIEDDFLFLLL